MSQVQRVLVIGGGIGGLAGAAAMAQRGLEVIVAEARSHFDEAQGVGLGQPANALRVLDDIGALDEVREQGFVFDRLEFGDHRGELYAAHTFRFGGTDVPLFLALPRRDLHSALLRIAREAGAQVRLSTTCASIEQNGDTVAVTFADGAADSFDVVVGFDGIRSATRRAMFGEVLEPMFSGYAAWRAIVARPDEVTAMRFYQGIAGKTGFMPLNQEQMYVFHIAPAGGDAWFEDPHALEHLREHLEPFGGVVGAVRDSLRDDTAAFYSPIEPMVATPPWHSGRVVIAGDAAHTFPPHLTQGAGMALEDGLVLADELSGDAPAEQSLANYVERRYPRCAFVSIFSERMLLEEQTIDSEEKLARARVHRAKNISRMLAAADRFLDRPVVSDHRRALS